MNSAAHQARALDWSVTEDKLLAALQRLVAAADPVRIVAFGSRAPGTAHRDSESINSVHHDIDEEGVVLYQKGAHGSPDRAAVAKICSGRERAL